MTKVLYPGSFDPIHNGHVELIETAAHLFDEVVVATMRNPQKGEPLFTLAEREEMIEESLGHLDNIEVLSFAKLVVDVAQEIGADFIIKGLRSTIDFESEISQAQINLNVSGVHTLFLPSASANSAIASKYIRDIARFGGDVSSMVPAAGRQAPAREVRVLMSDHYEPDELDLPDEPEQRPRTPGSDVEHMLRRLHDLVASARPMPLSTSVMVNRDEVLDLLDETIERLPDELRAARWLLKEREEYLAKVKREGEDILDQARTRAERMVQRTEVVKASEARARKIVDAANDEAARSRTRSRTSATRSWPASRSSSSAP